MNYNSHTLCKTDNGQYVIIDDPTGDVDITIHTLQWSIPTEQKEKVCIKILKIYADMEVI